MGAAAFAQPWEGLESVPEKGLSEAGLLWDGVAVIFSFQSCAKKCGGFVVGGSSVNH